MNAIRSYRWAIFVFAWLMFLASLPAPATATSFYILDHLPVGVLVLGSAKGIADGKASGMALLLMGGVFLFFLSPLFLIFRGRRGIDAPIRLLSLVLLCPWVFAIKATLNALAPGADPGSSPLPEWGYYLFATAHAVLLVICLLGPPAYVRPQKERGFDVLPASRVSNQRGQD